MGKECRTAMAWSKIGRGKILPEFASSSIKTFYLDLAVKSQKSRRIHTHAKTENVPLTLSQTSPGFYVSAISPFSKAFSSHLEKFLSLSSKSAKSFSLESKICRLGKS